MPANDKVYIHEFIDIIGHNRANYMHHMTANWSPIGQREREQLCYGVWGTVGSTGRWPEVVNIWEHDGFAGLAESFRTEFGHPTLQDPALHEWWARAASFRRGGIDRILVPAPWTRPITELCSQGVRGETYAHELVRVPPGTAWDFLQLVADRGTKAMSRFGWELAGAWVVAMGGEREAIVLWAIPSWEAWAEYEGSGRADRAPSWDSLIMETADEFDRILLVDSPLCPFRTGRQPAESDRDSYQLP